MTLQYRDGETPPIAAGAVQTPLYRPRNGPATRRFWTLLPVSTPEAFRSKIKASVGKLGIRQTATTVAIRDLAAKTDAQRCELRTHMAQQQQQELEIDGQMTLNGTLRLKSSSSSCSSTGLTLEEAPRRSTGA